MQVNRDRSANCLQTMNLIRLGEEHLSGQVGYRYQQKPGCQRNVVASKGVMQMTEWNPTHAQIPKLAQAKGTNSLDVCTPVALEGTVCPLGHCFHNTHTHCFLHCRGSLLSLQSNHPILHTASHLTLTTPVIHSPPSTPPTHHTSHPPTTLHTCHPLHLSPTIPSSTPVTHHTILHTCHPLHLSPTTPVTLHTILDPHLSPTTPPCTPITNHICHPSHLSPSHTHINSVIQALFKKYKLQTTHCERLAQARQLVLVGGGMLQAPLRNH